MLEFNEPVFYGRLLRRYKRFLMDIRLDDGNEVVAHSPNTGSMLGLLDVNSRVLVTKSADEKRACPFTVQAIEVNGAFVGINTHAPNKLIKASLMHPLLGELRHYASVKPEMRYGDGLRSRVDFYFSASRNDEPPLFLEIKNVTLKIGDRAQFPDAVSSRALKHVHDLASMIKKGSHAALWFVVQRQDCNAFSAASHIDHTYAQALALAVREGIRVRALAARIDDTGLALTHELPCITESLF
jgi:sugar fermentation stimulation protein A